MLWLLVPVLTFISLASYDDLHRFWRHNPHAGCHFLYHERMVLGAGLAWPLVRSTQVLCWQESELTHD